MIDPQRLRDLADTLDQCEWNHALGSADICRAAADELELLHLTLQTLRYDCVAARNRIDEILATGRESDG